MSEQIQARLQAMDAVLGSMLIDDRCVGPVMASLTAEDFTEPARKMIFVSIQHLFEQGKAIDPVTVLAETGQREELYGFVSDLLAITPTAANVMHYAALVKKQALLSKLQTIGSKLLEVSDAETAETLISQANNLMAGRAQHTTYTMEQLLANFYERHDPKHQAVYLDWPLEDLTREVYAEKGDMVVIGGYPSDGKTSLALWFTYHMAKSQRVGFFSYETGKDKLFDRLVAMNARIELPAMKRNELSQHDWDTLAVVSGKLTGAKLEIIEANGLTVSQIRAKSLARRYDAVFIDYLQKIKPSGAQRNADSFDCPPAFNAASAAALAAATDVIIPIKMDAFFIRGLRNVTRQIGNMHKINPNLRVAGALITMWRNVPVVLEAEALVSMYGGVFS